MCPLGENICFTWSFKWIVIASSLESFFTDLMFSLWSSHAYVFVWIETILCSVGIEIFLLFLRSLFFDVSVDYNFLSSVFLVECPLFIKSLRCFHLIMSKWSYLTFVCFIDLSCRFFVFIDVVFCKSFSFHCIINFGNVIWLFFWWRASLILHWWHTSNFPS